MMPLAEQDWRRDAADAASSGSASALTAVLGPVLGTLPDKQARAVKHQALQVIEAALPDPKRLVRLASGLAQSGDETAQELAVFLLSGHYTAAPDETAERLRILAESPHATVRRWTGEACGTLLVKQFQAFYPQLAAWSASPMPHEVTAVAHAVRIAAKTRNPAWSRPLLDLIELLMSGTPVSAGKPISPLTLGEGLLASYPEETAARLDVWIASAKEAVRIHATNMYASTAAAEHWDLLAPAFAKLEQDVSPAVRRAVVRARKQLLKRLPPDRSAPSVQVRSQTDSE
ncbi:hypothetical protein SAMN04487970_100927 [Paenibacillus tianmuensis]|uniref:HEAT repeat-containing protein n=2 Tax=Paenibacillus tianmuensis TaxID=624147 RepID=A0A1G4QUE7_9BACL|nr:hypothetical protein SAMN04487970_100927 [Paenibacillus tianmuensis]